MKRTRSRFFFSGALATTFLLLVAAPHGSAQTDPSPAQDGAAGAEAVKLGFKYTTGQIQKFRGTAQNDFTLSLGEGGGGLGPIPMNQKVDFVLVEKVLGTRQGTGTLSIHVPTLTLAMNVLGTDIVMKSVNNKVNTLVNGEPQQLSVPGGPGNPAAALKGANIPFSLRRDAYGAQSPVPGSKPPTSPLLREMTTSFLQFPEKPVAVGDSWETTMKSRPEVGGPGSVPGAAPEFEVKYVHTLKSVETKNGVRYALIESIGSGTAPGPDGMPGSSQDVSGTTRFDIARGVVVSGQYTATLNLKLGGLQLPGAAAGGAANGQASPAMSLDGQVITTFMEVPVTPVKKPVAKKPVAKKPVAKKPAARKPVVKKR